MSRLAEYYIPLGEYGGKKKRKKKRSIERATSPCFIYLPFPDNEKLISVQQSAIRDLITVGVPYERVERDHFHISLMIIEDCPEEVFSSLLLNYLPPVRFDIDIPRLEILSDTEHAAYVANVDPNPALLRIQNDLYQKVIQEGLVPHKFMVPSVWKPHITLAHSIPDDLPDHMLPRITPFKVPVSEFVVSRDENNKLFTVHLPQGRGDRAWVAAARKRRKDVDRETCADCPRPATIEVDTPNGKKRWMCFTDFCLWVENDEEVELYGILSGDPGKDEVVKRDSNGHNGHMELTRDQMTELLGRGWITYGPLRRIVTLEDGPFAERATGSGQSGVGGSKPGSAGGPIGPGSETKPQQTDSGADRVPDNLRPTNSGVFSDPNHVPLDEIDIVADEEDFQELIDDLEEWPPASGNMMQEMIEQAIGEEAEDFDPELGEEIKRELWEQAVDDKVELNWTKIGGYNELGIPPDELVVLGDAEIELRMKQVAIEQVGPIEDFMDDPEGGVLSVNESGFTNTGDENYVFGRSSDGGIVAVSMGLLMEGNVRVDNIVLDHLESTGGDTNLAFESGDAAGAWTELQWLSSKEQENGYGTQLMETAFRQAAEDGSGLYLHYTPAAETFYEQFGDVIINEIFELAVWPASEVTKLVDMADGQNTAQSPDSEDANEDEDAEEAEVETSLVGREGIDEVALGQGGQNKLLAIKEPQDGVYATPIKDRKAMPRPWTFKLSVENPDTIGPEDMKLLRDRESAEKKLRRNDVEEEFDSSQISTNRTAISRFVDAARELAETALGIAVPFRHFAEIHPGTGTDQSVHAGGGGGPGKTGDGAKGSTSPSVEDISPEAPEGTPIPRMTHKEFNNMTSEEVDERYGNIYDNYWESLTPEVRAAVEEARAKLAAGTQTVDIHSTIAEGGELDAEGKPLRVWTPERTLLHDQIVDRAFEGAADPVEGENPKVIITGGIPGAGKSTTMESAGVNTEGMVVVNSDHVKEQLPEFEGWNAGLLHEEADAPVKRILDRATEERRNIVFDSTMKSGDKLLAIVKEFEDRGYDTEVIYVDVPMDTALNRATGRFVGGGEQGRFVDPAYIITHNAKNLDTLDRIKAEVDNWQHWDNSGGKGEHFLVDSGSSAGEVERMFEYRHLAPVHPGTGTDQSVHDPNFGFREVEVTPTLRLSMAQEKAVRSALKSDPESRHLTPTDLMDTKINVSLWVDPSGELTTASPDHARSAQRAFEKAEMSTPPTVIEGVNEADHLTATGYIRMFFGGGRTIGVEFDRDARPSGAAIRTLKDMGVVFSNATFVIDTGTRTRDFEGGLEAIEDAVMGIRVAPKVLAAIIDRHLAPIHPGTGTDQGVHAGGINLALAPDKITSIDTNPTSDRFTLWGVTADGDVITETGDDMIDWRNEAREREEFEDSDRGSGHDGMAAKHGLDTVDRFVARGIIEPFHERSPVAGAWVYMVYDLDDAGRSVQRGIDAMTRVMRSGGFSEETVLAYVSKNAGFSAEFYVGRHLSPTHPGTGTDQSVHDPTGGGGTGEGKKKGKDPLPAHAMTVTRNWEKEQDPQPDEGEQGIMIREDGTIIEPFEETETSVAFTPTQVVEAKKAGAFIYSHTHPTDLPLSTQDVIEPMWDGASEVRAVTTSGVYKMTFAESTVDDFDTKVEVAESARESFSTRVDRTQDRYLEIIGMTGQEYVESGAEWDDDIGERATREILHEDWTELAAKFPSILLFYGKEDR